MGYMPSLSSNKPPSQPHGIPQPSLPPVRSLAGSPKSALLVEDVECLSSFFWRCLDGEGYAVRTASSSEEGLRLYRDLGPFNVVLINYEVPQRRGLKIDFLEPQTNGIELALAIRGIDSAQGIIIAANAFSSTTEVPRPPEAMHIPVLANFSVCQLRSLLEKIEVDRAINALTSADFLRLRQIAKSLIRILGRAARGRDSEDLLGEAVCRSLIGAGNAQNGRHWNRKVPFVLHLAGAMKSIASMWKRQWKERETYLVSELPMVDAEGQEHFPLDNLPSLLAPVDHRLVEKDEEEKLLAMFEDDHEATLVLRGLMDGLNRTEIMGKSGICANKYAAAVKRIRLKFTQDN